ncbi:phosphopantetheine--protein transferase-like protein [Desulfosalsimonas propionicica]|uniref:Phosphopantetheine--protein transferase-like protein n=1 Tax=Desulfosalsimonas propionicica TaxID=332175 RepID=A0A7W0C778_9BACT|nr:4'-phosphopantetheinyl transferase superfamily protein [Desulfosalsimonas propionicica]MBA2880372.1 phosphopantetheine--protein transferase-like protein [Desulfosalsimonas propionicica]
MSELPETMKILEAGGAALWQAPLDLGRQQTGRLEKLLSKEEIARARRFLSEAHRRRFIAAHGILRQILSGLTGICPNHLVFENQGRGKPTLKNDLPFDFFCFNLSHSCEMMLLGVCLKGPVGVDVESITPRADIFGLADRFFFPGEVRAIRSLSPEPAKMLFYRYWTLKEAYLKATGEGIARLGDIEIRHQAGGGYGIIDRGCCMDEKWRIMPIDIRSGYTGAFAVAARSAGFDMTRITAVCYHP